jgi:phage baseplate assembly protein W
MRGFEGWKKIAGKGAQRVEVMKKYGKNLEKVIFRTISDAMYASRMLQNAVLHALKCYRSCSETRRSERCKK